MNILLIILVLLVVTRSLGELAERARLPALVGELVAGVLLGLMLQRFHGLTPSIWSIILWSATGSGSSFKLMRKSLSREKIIVLSVAGVLLTGMVTLWTVTRVIPDKEVPERPVPVVTVRPVRADLGRVVIVPAVLETEKLVTARWRA